MGCENSSSSGSRSNTSHGIGMKRVPRSKVNQSTKYSNSTLGQQGYGVEQRSNLPQGPSNEPIPFNTTFASNVTSGYLISHSWADPHQWSLFHKPPPEDEGTDQDLLQRWSEEPDHRYGTASGFRKVPNAEGIVTADRSAYNSHSSRGIKYTILGYEARAVAALLSAYHSRVLEIQESPEASPEKGAARNPETEILRSEISNLGEPPIPPSEERRGSQTSSASIPASEAVRQSSQSDKVLTKGCGPKMIRDVSADGTVRFVLEAIPSLHHRIETANTTALGGASLRKCGSLSYVEASIVRRMHAKLVVLLQAEEKGEDEESNLRTILLRKPSKLLCRQSLHLRKPVQLSLGYMPPLFPELHELQSMPAGQKAASTGGFFLLTWRKALLFAVGVEQDDMIVALFDTLGRVLEQQPHLLMGYLRHQREQNATKKGPVLQTHVFGGDKESLGGTQLSNVFSDSNSLDAKGQQRAENVEASGSLLWDVEEAVLYCAQFGYLQTLKLILQRTGLLRPTRTAPTVAAADQKDMEGTADDSKGGQAGESGSVPSSATVLSPTSFTFAGHNQRRRTTSIIKGRFVDVHEVVNCHGPKHQPPVLLAASRGHADVVEYLLFEHNATIFVHDHFGYTVLHWAAYLGSTQLVEVVERYYRQNPKFLSVRGEKTLWELANLRTVEGRTALHYAAINNHISVGRALVSTCSANVNAREELAQGERAGFGIDNKGWAPLHHAVQNSHWNFVSSVLATSKKLEVRLMTRNGKSIVDLATKEHKPRAKRLFTSPDD